MLQIVTDRLMTQAPSMRIRDIYSRPAGLPEFAEVSTLGMGDPQVIPLWYSEGDLPTPTFNGGRRQRRPAGRAYLLSVQSRPARAAFDNRGVPDRLASSSGRIRTRSGHEFRHERTGADGAGADR